MGTVDEYLAGLGESHSAALGRVLAIARQEAPEAAEHPNGIPALRYRGNPLREFWPAVKHLAVYPSSPTAVPAVREQLSAAGLSKSTVGFTAEAPLPEVRKIRSFDRALLLGDSFAE